MAGKLTRTELEERLDETTESISRRFGRLDGAARPNGLVAATRIAGHRVTRVTAMVGAGLVAGWMLFSAGRRFRSRRRTEEQVLDELIEEVREDRELGLDERRALQRALRRRRDAGGGSMSGGLISFVLGYAVRTGVQTLVSGLVEQWTRRDRDGDAADGDGA